MKIHIGKEIARIQKLRGVSNEELAAAINTSVRNISHIKNKEDLFVDQLYKLSEKLNYNFFKLFEPVIVEPNVLLQEEAKKYTRASKKHTIKFEVQYPTELSPELGKFMMHVDALASKMGFDVL